MSTTQLGAMSGNSSDTPADAAPTTAQCLRWRPGAIRWPPGIGWWYDHPCALISESMRATVRRCKPLVRGWSPWTPTQRLRLVHRLVYHCSFQALHAMIWSTFRSCPGSICFHASAWWLHGRKKKDGVSDFRGQAQAAWRERKWWLSAVRRAPSKLCAVVGTMFGSSIMS